MIKLHLGGLGVVSLVIFLLYPTKKFSYYLIQSANPEMFTISAFIILIFISYLILKIAIFNIQGVTTISIKDWLLYTEIKTISYLWGRISFGLLYTLFLILLFLPLLLVSASISAIHPSNLHAIIVIIYLITFNLFLFGLFLHSMFKIQNWLLTLIIWLVVLFLLLLSPTLFPKNHPAILLITLQKSTDLISDFLPPIIFSLISIIFFFFFSLLSIFFYRRSLYEQ